MDSHKCNDEIRIFVFRPYVPIFLRKSEILSYETLLNEISKQCGSDFGSIHLMSGMEVKKSDELKHDKVYIAVEKDFQSEDTRITDVTDNDTSALESSSSSESASDSSLCNKVKENRKSWSKQSRFVSKDITSKEDVFIYVHSLYTYKNSLHPYGCTLKYRDLKLMEHILIKIAIILKPPGDYIMGLFDIHKNQITDPSQLKNKHHYLAMPHIISYNGYNLLKNLSPEIIEKYDLHDHEDNVAEKKDETKVLKQIVYDAEAVRKDEKSSLEQPMEEHVKVHLEKRNIAQPVNTSSKTIHEEESSFSSSSNASSKISYYTIENKSNNHLKNDILDSKSSAIVPGKISYYTCDKKPSKLSHVETQTESKKTCHHKNCDCECNRMESPQCSQHTVQDLKHSLTTITKALSFDQDVTPILKNTSHHLNLQIKDDASCNSSDHNCRSELAENLLETLLHDIRHGKIKSPLLDSNGGSKDKTEAEIVEPLLLSCELVIDVFQRISKSLNERKTKWT